MTAARRYPLVPVLGSRAFVVPWLVLVVLVIAVGVAPGLQDSLVWTAAATTAWMPCLTLVAAWQSRRPRSVADLLALLVLFAVVVVLLVGFELLLVSGSALSPLQQYFPILIAPGALLFVSFLQVTMVCELRPFVRLGGLTGGLLALLVCAVVAVVAYRLLVNWDGLPPAGRPDALLDPHGPIAGTSLITWLTVTAAWQVIVVVVLSGQPGRLWRRTSTRLAVNNLAVLGGATATYFVATAAGVSGPVLSAVAACAVAGGRLPFCLFTDGVDPRGSLVARAGLGVATTVVLVAVLLAVTSAGRFDAQPAGLWVAVAGLNLISGGVTFAASVVSPAVLSQPSPLSRPARS